MKKFYNTFIKWTFGIIAVLVCVPLLIAKVAMLLIIKVVKVIRFVVNELFIATMRITDGLEDRLSVKD